MKAEHSSSSAVLGILITRFTLRHWVRSWKETLALVLLLAIGVGAYLSIRMANRASIASFQGFAETLTGETDGILQSAAGQLDLDDLRQLRERRGSQPVLLLPVLEILAAFPSEETTPLLSGNWVQLVGLDLIQIQNIPNFQQRENQLLFQDSTEEPQGTVFESLALENAVFVHPAWAREKGLEIGDTFPLLIQDREVVLEIFGFLPVDPRLPQPSESMMILDIGDLQRLAASEGQFSRIELLAEPGRTKTEQQEQIAGWAQDEAPAHWIFSSPAEQQRQGATMTRAFRLNLTILSLIALVVSLYLILQAMEAAVVRRRPEIATLRSLGIDQKTLLHAWLLESLLLGLMGSIGGILLGWFGAQFSVQAVGQTMNALYQATAVDAAQLSWQDAGIGLVLGVGCGLLTGWIPAREASRTPPAQVLSRGYQDPGLPFLQRSDWGGILIGAGILLSFLPPLELGGGTRFPLFGYVAALFWMVGGSLVLPLLIKIFASWLVTWARPFPAFFLAVSRLRNPTGRHKLAAAGLLIAIGMANGMSLLIGSFEFTMQNWIQHTLQADLYVTSKANQTASSEARISETTRKAIAERPEFAQVEYFSGYRITLQELPTLLGGINFERALQGDRFRFLQEAGDLQETPIGDSADLIPAIVSESFKNRFQVKLGESVPLPFPETGPREARILGIYADYGNERGAILIPEAELERGYGEKAVNSIAMDLNPGFQAEQVRLDLISQFPALQIQTNQSLRQEVLRIFRQTFSITYALKAIAVFVAIAGLALGLIGLLLEYRIDLTTLRALGMRKREMARVTAWEGFSLTFTALLGGLLLSFALGYLLIYVINRQSFGWTLGYAIPGWEMMLFGLAILLAGTLVSWMVGYWGAQLPADREE